MTKPVDVTLRLTVFEKPLVDRLRAYVEREWGGHRGAMKVVVKQALTEYLDKREKTEQAVSSQ